MPLLGLQCPPSVPTIFPLSYPPPPPIISSQSHLLTLRTVGCRKRRLEAASVSDEVSSSAAGDSEEAMTEEEVEACGMVGSRIRVTVPLTVSHVPKVGEIELTGKEGVIQQYVGLWKGKRISANLPFKVEFLGNSESGGPAKFFAHLRKDEFDVID